MTRARSGPDAGWDCWAACCSLPARAMVAVGVGSAWARAATCFASSRFATSPDTSESPSVTKATEAGKIAFHILDLVVVDAPQRRRPVLQRLQLRYYCGHAIRLSFFIL